MLRSQTAFGFIGFIHCINTVRRSWRPLGPTKQRKKKAFCGYMVHFRRLGPLISGIKALEGCLTILLHSALLIFWVGVMCRLVVSIDHPHQIIDVESKMYFVLGHRPKDLRQNPLDVILGPKSDTALLYQSIQAASESGMASQFQMMLYEQSGKCRNMQISCCRNLDDVFGDHACALSLDLPSTIVVDEVYQDNTCGWALASSEWPHGIQMVNSKFTSEFGFSAEEATGLNLHQIITSVSDFEDWRIFLGLACEGQRTQGAAAVTCKSGKQSQTQLSFLPVQTVANGAIEHIMVRCANQLECPFISDCGRSEIAGYDPLPPEGKEFLQPAGGAQAGGHSPVERSSPPAALAAVVAASSSDQTYASRLAGSSGRLGGFPAAPKRCASDGAIFASARPCPANRRSEPLPAAHDPFSDAWKGDVVGIRGGAPCAGHPVLMSCGGGGSHGSAAGSASGIGGESGLSMEEYVRRLQRRHEAAERRARRRQAPSPGRTAEPAGAAAAGSGQADGRGLLPTSGAHPHPILAASGWPLGPAQTAMRERSQGKLTQRAAYFSDPAFGQRESCGPKPLAVYKQ